LGDYAAISLASRSFCYDIASVNGKEFIRRATKWAKTHETGIVVDASRGKGGHQVVRIGVKWTIVQTGELTRHISRDAEATRHSQGRVLKCRLGSSPP
jgi:hypothetical protein